MTIIKTFIGIQDSSIKTVMGEDIGSIKTILGSGLNLIAFDELAPSDLVLTVINDTSIKLDWTVNSTNRDGHSIERSTDGVNYSEIDTVLADTATYTDTTGSQAIRYYYRVKAYQGTNYSDPCTAANDWCAIKATLTPLSGGAGVATAKFIFTTTNVIATLDGSGRWYSDSGGTLDESTSYTFVAGEERTRYYKVPSGTSNMMIFAKGNFTSFYIYAAYNSSTISCDITNITSLQSINMSRNALTGSIEALTSLTFLNLEGSNTITGSIEALTSLINFTVRGGNTLSGDISKIVNGITIMGIDNSSFVDYTSGAVWSLMTSSQLRPGTGYGYSATEIDNIIIDMAASLGTLSNKTIELKGSSAARTSASDAAVTTLNGKGWTIVTN